MAETMTKEEFKAFVDDLFRSRLDFNGCSELHEIAFQVLRDIHGEELPEEHLARYEEVIAAVKGKVGSVELGERERDIRDAVRNDMIKVYPAEKLDRVEAISAMEERAGEIWSVKRDEVLGEVLARVESGDIRVSSNIIASRSISHLMEALEGKRKDVPESRTTHYFIQCNSTDAEKIQSLLSPVGEDVATGVDVTGSDGRVTLRIYGIHKDDAKIFRALAQKAEEVAPCREVS